MQRRGDLYADLATEVHVQDMTRMGDRAGEAEALGLAKIIAKDNGDAVVGKLPSPLVAHPEALHAFMTGTLPLDELAKQKPYAVIRGGAYVTKLGRIFVIEFKSAVNEAQYLPPRPATMNTTQHNELGQQAHRAMNAAGEQNRKAKLDKEKAATAELPKPGQTKDTYKVDPRVVGLTNQDEGSSTHVSIISKSPKLYQADFNADQRFKFMRDDSSFHFNENTPLGRSSNQTFRPMTMELYQKITDRVQRLRANPAPAAPQQAAPAQPTAQPKRRRMFGFL